MNELKNIFINTDLVEQGYTKKIGQVSDVKYHLESGNFYITAYITASESYDFQYESAEDAFSDKVVLQAFIDLHGSWIKIDKP